MDAASQRMLAMSIRLLTLLLLLAQVAIGLAALLVLLFFVVHVVQGGPFTTNWLISAQAPVTSFPLANDAGALRIDRGTLALASSDWRPELVQLVCVWAFAVGANLAIQRLKAVLAAIGAGKPFDTDIVRGLRMIGYLMLAWVGLDIVDALIAQPLILANAVPSDTAIALSSSISRPTGSFAHVFRLDFHIGFLKIAAGLFALALARAFAIGRNLAEDAEAIV
jgi:hypothetical protein